MARPIDQLNHVLVFEKPTEEQFIAYCLLLEEDMRVPFAPMDAFYKPGDLEQYWAAKAWWPKDAPPRFQMPLLTMIARGRQAAFFRTFTDYLNTSGRNCGQWLLAEGRSLEDPNETPEERKARKGRESAQRYRDRNVRNVDPAARAAADAAQALYQEYTDLCKERRSVEADYKLRIAQKWEDYQAAKSAHQQIVQNENTPPSDG